MNALYLSKLNFNSYLPESADLHEFKQLIGGVVWLVRNGINYVNEAIKAEYEETQTSGMPHKAGCKL